MSVDVVVPFLGGCPHRERAREWVTARYSWPVTLAPGHEPWCKAEALRPAIERSCADVVIVADADCFTDGIKSAVLAITCGVAGWAIPHGPDIRRLSEQGTAAVLLGEVWEDQELEQRPYRGVAGGGIVVARRDVLLDVPMDPRFVGFGQEDESWGIALWTLHGKPWRGATPLVHLYHPPQERLSRRWGSIESRRLRMRYQAARGLPDAMRALLNETQGETCDSTVRPIPTSASVPRPTG